MSAKDAVKTTGFDLQGVVLGSRFKAWSNALNGDVFSFDTEYPTDFCFGKFEGVVTDTLWIANVTLDPVHVERHATHVARDATDAYFLVLPCGGDMTLRQRGSEVTIGQGQFTFVSTTEPYSHSQERTARFHAVSVPGDLVRARKPDADDHIGGDFRASGMQRIFAEFAASFCRHAPSLDAEALERTRDNLLDLLTLVLERSDTGSDETVVRLAHRRRIMSAVESSFRDTETSLASIAQALGLSPRYIQQILAAHGETLSDLLRRRRVAEACRLLDRRGTSRSQIATIAFSVGYTDPAYFSRVFRMSVGMSPLDYAVRVNGT